LVKVLDHKSRNLGQPCTFFVTELQRPGIPAARVPGCARAGDAMTLVCARRRLDAALTLAAAFPDAIIIAR
jgi:hypothetical protein